MDAITELTTLDFSSTFISVFVILVGIKAVVSLFEWGIEKLGIETKWMKGRREDHELLVKTAQNVLELQERHNVDIHESDQHDEEMRNDIKKLIEGFMDLQISNMRREILSISDNIINGKKIGKESYLHCLKIYDQYEKIIREHNFKNSEVDLSIELVRQSYRDFLNKELKE